MSRYYIETAAAMRYYMLATESGEREVGGFFEFRIDEHGNTIVTGLDVVKQDASYAHFTIDDVPKALWLEKIVGEGKDPSNFGLFHTHPTGMGSSMSGVDVKQIEEMATDLPGVVARSMILSQGKLHPTMNEAVFAADRVWRRDDLSIALLDDTGAHSDLKEIGWFDKPKPLPVTRGFTAQYAAGARNSRELVPMPNKEHLRSWARAAERIEGARGGWYDEAPMNSEVTEPQDTAAYSEWLDDKYAIEDAEEDAKHSVHDAAQCYIGVQVDYKGAKVTVVDAYVYEGQIVLVMPDNEEIRLDETTVAEEVQAS